MFLLNFPTVELPSSLVLQIGAARNCRRGARKGPGSHLTSPPWWSLPAWSPSGRASATS